MKVSVFFLAVIVVAGTAFLRADEKKKTPPPPEHHAAATHAVPPPRGRATDAGRGQPSGGRAYEPARNPRSNGGGAGGSYGGAGSGGSTGQPHVYTPSNTGRGSTGSTGTSGGYTPAGRGTQGRPESGYPGAGNARGGREYAPSAGGAHGGYPSGGNAQGGPAYTPSGGAHGGYPSGGNAHGGPAYTPSGGAHGEPGGYARGGTGHGGPTYARPHGTPTIYHPPLGATRGSNGRIAAWRGRNGSEARFSNDGHVRSVHTGNMTIVHAPWGGRQVIVDRGNHTRIFTNGAGHGWVQKPFHYRGHDYASRTYFYHGRPYVRYYRPYSYRGVELVGYTPFHYYSPVFYGWAYHYWARPVSYRWGWYGSPWYGYYGGYFTPYDSYPSAAFWLTDYLIAASLENAYQQQLDAQAQAQAQMQAQYGAPGGQVALTPEVKQAIADEVQRQLALENAERQQASQNIEPNPESSGLPRMLGDGSTHVFVVSAALDLTDAQGQSCVVTEGDVLQMQSPPPQEATAGFLDVMASKGQDCPTGDVVTVAFADLQEMQNHMRSTIDGGLDQLQAQAGQGGLPPAPPGANTPPVQSAFAPVAPPPDPNVSSELNQEALASNQTEQQVISEAGSGGGQ